jgi:hypothetical protein
MRAALGLALVVLLSSATACDRNIEPYPGDEAPREPDLSRIFPEPAAPVPHEHEDGETQPIAQQTSRAGSAKGPTITGEIRLGGGEPPAGAMLFVIARAAGSRGGPPLAVLRVPQPQFPYAFELSQANVMIPSLRFSGEMDVTARLDSDGNAMTKDATDLEGRAAAARRPGDSGVLIVLGPAGA